MTAVEWYYDQTVIQGKTNFYELLEEATKMEYKQNMNALQKGMELQKKENNRIGFRERNGLLSSQTEISDEDIEKEADKKFHNTHQKKEMLKFISFCDGAKWYREQLKSKMV